MARADAISAGSKYWSACDHSLVSAAAVQFQGQVALFRGWEQDKPCYRCFVGDAFDAEDCDTCAADGVLGAFVGMVGALAASDLVVHPSTRLPGAVEIEGGDGIVAP